MTALLAATVCCVAANAFIVTADIAKAKFVMDNSAAVGVRAWQLPYLALVKAAGAVGLVIGLVGVTALGTAAAIGLIAFYAGAVVVHVRARVLHNIAFPLAYLVLAAAALAYFVAAR